MHTVCLRNKNKRLEERLVLDKTEGKAMGNEVFDQLHREKSG